MSSYTVVFDACVLYPYPLRSYLMYLNAKGLFRAKWSDMIHDEWIRNAIKNNPARNAEALYRARKFMDTHAPDALVTGFEGLIDGLELPDPDDRHVLAAAIRGQAEGIITFNLKDFPIDTLEQYGVTAIHPDEFLCDMYELDASSCLWAAQEHRCSLKNPPFSVDEYLQSLQKQKLPEFVSKLKQMSWAI